MFYNRFKNGAAPILTQPLAMCVRPGGLEPPRPKTLDPKSNAATNYATGANVPQRYDFFLNCRPLCATVSELIVCRLDYYLLRHTGWDTISIFALRVPFDHL